ncbi:hypothetical protein ACSSS7_001904 [Eimeria intestinalis]
MTQDKNCPLLTDPVAIEASDFACSPPPCCGGGTVPYRDLQKARLAFITRDIDATRQASTH